jgi:hypothetical protein
MLESEKSNRMKSKSWIVTALFSTFLVVSGCAVQSPVAKAGRFETRITPGFGGNPNRIRFDVYGDPYSPAKPGSEEASQPVHEQIRLGMQRYAAIKLTEAGLCPKGFKGPDFVLADYSNRLDRFFFIDCL